MTRVSVHRAQLWRGYLSIEHSYGGGICPATAVNFEHILAGL
jgi:hypothetical protein